VGTGLRYTETKRWEFFFTENPDFTSFEDVNSSGPLEDNSYFTEIYTEDA
jgi:hypothetical protein